MKYKRKLGLPISLNYYYTGIQEKKKIFCLLLVGQLRFQVDSRWTKL